MDFSKTLIRCSSISKIMAEPIESRGMTPTQDSRLEELQLKHDAWGNHKGNAKGGIRPLTDKQLVELAVLREKKNNPPLPELGKTAIDELTDIYLREKYGIISPDKDKMIKYTEKGKLVEEDAITLLALVDGKMYYKNGERVNNDYISGEPDIWEGEHIRNADKIIDIKSSWDAKSFQKSKRSKINPTYWWQMQGYMGLTGAQWAEVCYCLVNTPMKLINDEKRRLLWSGDYVTDEDPIYKAKCELLEHSMTFDHIPRINRIVKFRIQRDDDAINRVYERVKICRNWLQETDNLDGMMYIASN